MPTSSLWKFTDPDEYTERTRAAKFDLAVTQAGYFEAKLTRIDLHRLWMQRFSENLSRVLHFECDPARAIISFATQGGSGFVHDGSETPAELYNAAQPGSWWVSACHRSGAFRCHVASDCGYAIPRSEPRRMRLRAAEGVADYYRAAHRDGEASETSRSGRIPGGAFPRDHRQHRCCAWPGAGVDRRYDGLSLCPRQAFVGKSRACPHYGEILRHTESTSKRCHPSPGTLRGDRRFHPHTYYVL